MNETNNQEQQAPQQQASTPAPVQQEKPAVVANAAAAFNPLNGVHLTNELMPYASALAAPYESFIACFKDKKEGQIKWHSEIEYAVMQLTAAGKPGDFLRASFKQNPMALINAVKQVPMTGLSLNPTLKQSYLVPFKGVITFMPSYMGLADILVRTGLVKSIDARMVYVDDVFEVEFGENHRLIHKPNPFSKNREKKDILGAYWIAILPDGTKKFDTMSIDEIVKIQQRSPSGSNGPWISDFGEMAKKTLIRRAFKSLPHSGVSEENLKVLEVTMENDNQFFYEQAQPKRAIRNEFEELDSADFQPSFEVQQEA